MSYLSISIFGKPNVGKSTFLNTLFEKKVTIATHKPQTTRNMIELSYKKDNYQIDFIDTPGFHKPRNKLDLFLNSEAKKSLKKADKVLFFFDCSKEIDNEDLECLKILKNFKVKNVYLVINKIDLVEPQYLLDFKKNLYDLFLFKNCFQICSKNSVDVLKVIDFFIDDLKNTKTSKNDMGFTFFEKMPNDEFFVSEIIREQVINLYRQEIPYGVAIKIEEFNYDSDSNVLFIKFLIFVEKQSQKPILIGKSGNAIKNLNFNIRNKLLEIYDCKIVTKSEVKVKKDWRNDEIQIRELGYKK